MNNSMNDWRKHLIFFTMVMMLAGLLFSRGLLSSGLILFAILSLVHKNILFQLRTFISSPFLLSICLLFLIPLVSGLWSEDSDKWSQIMRIKLPLLLLPACFAGLNNLQSKDWERIAMVFVIIILIGVGWSFWQYMQDVKGVHTGYLQAHTIQTPIGNDHVRFSLVVAFAILTSVYLLIKKRENFPLITRVLLNVTIAIFIVYLHILAVRTGLLCFYTGIFIFILWSLWCQPNKLRSAIFLVILISLPVISWFIFPTFKNRVSYLRYDLSFIKKDIYLEGSNDGTRIISMKGGCDLQNNNPIGVGFGDIQKEMSGWYRLHYPQMIETDKILPSSEWLMYGAGAGWPGFILFTAALLVPFFTRGLRRNIVWWILNISMALSYLFDIGLEVQFGVFVHAFILLWWYRWLRNV